MSRKESGPVRFEELVRPSRDAWMALLGEFKKLFSSGDTAVIYGNGVVEQRLCFHA